MHPGCQEGYAGERGGIAEVKVQRSVQENVQEGNAGEGNVGERGVCRWGRGSVQGQGEELCR